MSELFFFGNYDVKETVLPSVSPYETGNAYLYFAVGNAPYDPLNNNFVGGGFIKYVDTDTNIAKTSSFKINDNSGNCTIHCYNKDLDIYAYIDVQRVGGDMERLDLKSIECNGDIMSYSPTGTVIPKFTGNNANINVSLNFE